MIYSSLYKLKSAIPKKARLLGLDVGSKTIGLAISDSDLIVASAVETIRRTKFINDIKELENFCFKRHIGGMIIGLPISMDGSEGPACQSVRQFSVNLDGEMETKIAYWDERLSTAAIERLLIQEANLTRKRRSKIVDKMAAAYILQGALDALNAKSTAKAEPY